MKETFNNITQCVILDWSLDYKHLEGKLTRWNSVSLTLIKKKTLLRRKERRFLEPNCLWLCKQDYQLRELSVEYMRVFCVIQSLSGKSQVISKEKLKNKNFSTLKW